MRSKSYKIRIVHAVFPFIDFIDQWGTPISSLAYIKVLQYHSITSELRISKKLESPGYWKFVLRARSFQRRAPIAKISSFTGFPATSHFCIISPVFSEKSSELWKKGNLDILRKMSNCKAELIHILSYVQKYAHVKSTSRSSLRSFSFR